MSKLAEIFATKRREVSDAKTTTPIDELKRFCEDLPATLGFLNALKESTHSVSLIAEVKAKSPSAGTIRAAFDPAAIASAYKRAGADCLSVLTDVQYFGGNPRNIDLCKKASGLPVLRKDFIDDPYQIYEARSWGADAILLIVAALEKSQILDLSAEAKSVGLDVLVEVHSNAEVEIANECGCEFVGVNNRDLSTFQTDLAVSERLLPIIEASHKVSESALKTNVDIERVKASGARTVLIGTTFCASDDIEAKVREVMGW